LLLIAVFVWFGAAQESNLSQVKSAINGIPVQQAMVTDFKTVERRNTLEHAVELLLSGTQKDFPVTDNGRIKGLLTHADLLAALSKNGKFSSVSEAMRQQFFAVNAADMLETAMQRLNECNCSTLPVLDNNRLVGLLTADNLGKYMRVHEALNN
jgi:predicted transcriptional regulator